MLKTEIEDISARIDFCESSLSQLRKDLLVYLAKRSETSKQTTDLSKTLRNVASTEQHPLLQKSLFHSANVFTELDQLLVKYSNCEEESRLLLDDFSKYLVQPMREVIADSRQSMTKTTAKNNIDGDINLQQRIEHTQTILPYHSRLFERHRIKYMKTLLQNMIINEISYHCHVVEKLTPLLESLSNIQDLSVLEEESETEVSGK